MEAHDRVEFTLGEQHVRGRRIEFRGARARLRGLRLPLPLAGDRVLVDVGAAQRRVRSSRDRVARHQLLEQPDRAVHRGFVIGTTQVGECLTQPLRGRRIGARRSRRGRGRGNAQGSAHRRDQGVLGRERLKGGSVDTAAGDLGSSFGVDQLVGDTQRRARQADHRHQTFRLPRSGPDVTNRKNGGGAAS